MLDSASLNLANILRCVRVRAIIFAFALPIFIFAALDVRAQTTAFSYQGVLAQGGTPANGTFQMSFGLWTAQTGGQQVGTSIGPVGVSVVNGAFTTVLDFGSSAFPGADRFLEITVSKTVLAPRPKLESVPYAIRALTVSGPVAGTSAGATLTVTNAQPGISNPSPENLPPAALRGEATSTVDSNIGVLGVGNGSAGIGVLGLTNGNSPTSAQGDAIGVFGLSTSTKGDTTGIRGSVASSTGTAVEAEAPAGALLFKGSSDDPSSGNPKFVVTAGGQIRSNGAVFARGFHSNSELFGVTEQGNLSAATIETSSINSPGGTLNFGSSNLLTTGALNINGNVGVGGTLNIGSLPSGGNVALCTLSTAANVIRVCSSSLRYKNDVESFTGGLDIINRLRPITFKWKENGANDLGLGAEDVASVESRLVFYNAKGEIEGVRYNQLNAVLINAIKQQQEQIDRQQAQIDTLTRLVSRSNRRATSGKARR